MTSLADTVFAAVERATFQLAPVADEDALQATVADSLGSCERELAAVFFPPRFRPRHPPISAIEALAVGSPSIKLPPEGKDPCSADARLDILWNSPFGFAAIELKYCAERKADNIGYYFLKDLHRLERLRRAGSHDILADARFAIFVTKEPVYWRGGRPEPQPFWLTHGRRIESEYWVQYDQKSPNTLWYSYPPFFLANSYDLAWQDLQSPWRCLIVQVQPQTDVRT
jgi:hypothetical protein